MSSNHGSVVEEQGPEQGLDDNVTPVAAGMLMKPVNKKLRFSRQAVVLIEYRNSEVKDRIILDGSKDSSFRVASSQIVHDYDDYYQVDCRFDVKPDSNDPNDPDKFLHVYLHVSSQALRSSEANVVVKSIESLEEVPEELRNIGSIKQLLGQKSLRAIEITYDWLFRAGELDFETEHPDLHKLRNLKANANGTLSIFFRASRWNDILDFQNRILNTYYGTPLSDYYWQKGHCRSTNWASEKKPGQVPNFAYDPHTFFHHIDHWYITYAYGMMRNETYNQQEIREVRDLQRTIQICRIPIPNLDDDEPAYDRIYLAFAQISDGEASMKCFQLGEQLKVKFDDMDPASIADEATSADNPAPWSATVIDQLPGLDPPGNLTMLLYRPSSDLERQIKINETVFDNMESEDVYLQPENSGLPALRMMNALNAVHRSTGAKFDDLRRILRGQHPKGHFPFDYLDNLTTQEEQEIEPLWNLLREDQQSALLKLMEKNMFAFILGPPGTGKSFFIAVLGIMLAKLGYKVIITCSANAPVDTLARAFYIMAPWLKVIRYHSKHFESRTLKRKTQMKMPDFEAPGDDDADEEAEELTAEEKEKSHHFQQAFFRVIKYARELSSNARAGKTSRPNFAVMSLSARCLEVIETEEKGEVHEAVRRIREIIQLGPNHDYGDRAYREVFDDALEALETYVLGNAPIVLATMSNSCDKFLAKVYRPDIGISDEVASSTEAETLIMWTTFMETMKFFLGVGNFVRPSLMERRKTIGDRFIQFTENLRMVKGLEQPSSNFFYGGSLVPAPSCDLGHSSRWQSRDFLKYLDVRHGLQTGTPRLVLNVAQGVSIKDARNSRYNHYNICAALQELHAIMKAGIFTAKQIKIMTPYRRQCQLYLHYLYLASKLPEWQGLNATAIIVKTVDSFQGDEAGLAVLDMVTGSIRNSGPGFMEDYRRLNVALTRPKAAFLMLTDLEAPFQHRAEAQAAVDNSLSDESDEEDTIVRAEDRQAADILLKTYNYFRQEGSVVHLDKAQLPDTIVDLAESKEFEESKQITCRRCGNLGHMVKDCQEPRVIKCHYCDATDHLKDACDNRFAKKLCNNCGQMGHIKSSCPLPKVPTCSYCTTRGHKKADCPLMKVICKYCGVEGHTVNYCSSISGTERPCFSCGKFGHTAKDCQQTGTKDMQAQWDQDKATEHEVKDPNATTEGGWPGTGGGGNAQTNNASWE
ncbi:MAG: hypothetical protein Q9215_007194 [Flavoplaca cf. flavocitrina]